jgi:GNAT superfamily N-acetyltransferase
VTDPLLPTPSAIPQHPAAVELQKGADERRRRRLLLDRLGADGCPPLEQVDVEGWRLRAAAGVLLRANSALPLSEALSEALPIDAVVEFYRSRGLPPRVHVSTSQLDEELASRAWQRASEVQVMTGPVPTGPTTARVSPEMDEAWLDCYWSVDGRGGAAEREVLRRMLSRLGPGAAYASVLADGAAVAVARGVVQEGWLGLYAMAVLPEWRGRGLGRDILHALGSSAAQQGAHSIHLQVLAGNASARGLYAAAGLQPAHSYHYRVLP